MIPAFVPEKGNALSQLQYPDPPRLTASIPCANAIYSPTGHHITFTIHLTDHTNELTWMCTQRYSSFRSLHYSVGKHFVPSSMFPPLLLTGKANRNKAEIESRRKELEQYLKALLDACFRQQRPGGVPFHRVQKTLKFLEYPFVGIWDEITAMSTESELSDSNPSSSQNGSLPPSLTGSFGSRNEMGFMNSLGSNGSGKGGLVGSPTSRSSPNSARSDVSRASSTVSAYNHSGKGVPNPDEPDPDDYEHQPITQTSSTWKPPPKLPGARLGLSLPFAQLALTIEGEWVVTVKGDRNTRRAQLRHRYDELAYLCDKMSRENILPEVSGVQQMVATFRRAYPLTHYLRFETMSARSRSIGHMAAEQEAVPISSSETFVGGLGHPKEHTSISSLGSEVNAARGHTISDSVLSDDEQRNRMQSIKSMEDSMYTSERRLPDEPLRSRRCPNSVHHALKDTFLEIPVKHDAALAIDAKIAERDSPRKEQQTMVRLFESPTANEKALGSSLLGFPTMPRQHSNPEAFQSADGKKKYADPNNGMNGSASGPSSRRSSTSEERPQNPNGERVIVVYDDDDDDDDAARRRESSQRLSINNADIVEPVAKPMDPHKKALSALLGIQSPKPHANHRKSLADAMDSTPPSTPSKVPGTPSTEAREYTTYLAAIRGDVVKGCRCTKDFYCVCADGTGDVYRTMSGHIIVVAPPPFEAEKEEEYYTGGVSDLDRFSHCIPASCTSNSEPPSVANTNGNSNSSSPTATPKRAMGLRSSSMEDDDDGAFTPPPSKSRSTTS